MLMILDNSKLNDILYKIYTIIDSCKTIDQLNSCKNFLNPKFFNLDPTVYSLVEYYIAKKEKEVS